MSLWSAQTPLRGTRAAWAVLPEELFIPLLLRCGCCIPTAAWTCLGECWHVRQLQSHPVLRNSKKSVRKAKSNSAAKRSPSFAFPGPLLYVFEVMFVPRDGKMCPWDHNKLIYHLFLRSGKTN